LLWSNSGTARIGRHPAEVWQFSQGIVSGPWGFRVVSFCGLAEEGTGAAAVAAEWGVAAPGNAKRTQSKSWSDVSV